MTKYFKYRFTEFTLIPTGSGTIRVSAVWPSSRNPRLRRPVVFNTFNTLAYDNCDKESRSSKDIYKSAKDAQREIYNQYRNHINYLFHVL